MIVDAWNNVPFTYTPPGAAAPVTVNLRTALLDRDPTTLLPTQLAIQTATARVDVAGLPAGASGLNLTQAVVITEAEHDEDYVMQSGNEIVLVLPDLDRTTLVPAGAPLLATAEFLMACTPNGI
jgi:hypothetical protein